MNPHFTKLGLLMYVMTMVISESGDRTVDTRLAMNPRSGGWCLREQVRGKP